ncbi:MAG: type II toxin-antitoxin system Phd/YefM family antitoxin [Phycisphaerales bacterium]|jgi:prevent-host-death family protein|nr:type II toxin-antitoxin system Phd/YefM family antitoxin [Phycisphaerales bacterium]
MIVNTVTEAKAQLSSLLDRVCRGEEVIISRAGKPVAILEPYDETRRPRKPGALRGKIQIDDDFDALTPEIEEMFGLKTP